MKIKTTLYLCTLGLLLALTPGCNIENKTETLPVAGTEFVLGSGVNASHWLAQHFEGIPPKDIFFTQEDVQLLKDAGFQHLRIPVEEVEMWNEDGSPNEESFRYLDQALHWAQDAGLNAILDLHIIKAHHFNSEHGDGKNVLFTSEEAQQHLVGLWQQLSDRCHEWPNDFLAYEILNEAVAENHEDWNKLVAKCVAAIREKEPERFLVIGSNRWQQTQFFPFLKIPEGDRRIILSFHFYNPFPFTHYQAGWVGAYSDYRGPINYPGNIVPEDYLESLAEGEIRDMLTESFYNDKETLRAMMKPAIDYAAEHNLALYCGEWGTMPTMPREDRLQWYRDMSQVFREEGIENAIWSYKVEFGIRSNDNSFTDYELIHSILTGE
ncbi:MAG: cellulase family glycosylhydrolase [Opitutales bacterium]|nr:cellulase family glycosylhydrolase [Opitutales bacterium]